MRGMEKLTIKEYCERTGRLKQAVSRDIKQGRALKGVVAREKFGRTHILHFVDNQ